MVLDFFNQSIRKKSILKFTNNHTSHGVVQVVVHSRIAVTMDTFAKVTKKIWIKTVDIFQRARQSKIFFAYQI